MPLSYPRALVELLVAALFWGAGFICVRQAMDTLSPLWLTVVRFLFAVLFALPVLAFSRRARLGLTSTQLFLAALPGLSLSGTLILQTFGLRHTLVSKSAFITTLYVVFVPFLERLWLKSRVPKRHWFAVVVSLLGATFLSNLRWDGWNFGDSLTLACAMLAAVQIVDLHRISQRIENAYTFNLLQAVWATLLPLPFAFLFEPFHTFPWPSSTWSAVLFLSVLCTQLAFFIQVRTQRVIPSSTISMFFLLESPIAAGLAAWVFDEKLTPLQWTGAGLILFGAVLAIYRKK